MIRHMAGQRALGEGLLCSASTFLAAGCAFIGCFFDRVDSPACGCSGKLETAKERICTIGDSESGANKSSSDRHAWCVAVTAPGHLAWEDK